MSAKTHSPAEDLAFMRALVEGGAGGGTAAFGEIYCAAGLLYGLQIVIQSLPALGLAAPSAGFELVLGFGPTVLFLAFLAWSLWRHRGEGANAAQRAIVAVFGAVSPTWPWSASSAGSRSGTGAWRSG
jgi:hypothetical protein